MRRAAKSSRGGTPARFGPELMPAIDAVDDPEQLPLFLPAAASADSRSWSLFMTVEFPGGCDPELVRRLDKAGRRLRRGAVAAKWKLKKLADGLEDLAGLFDGATGRG